MQGDDKAQYNLGLMYKTGDGVAQDYVIAYALINAAAVTDDKARKTRNSLTTIMTPTQIEAGQALTRRMQAVGIDKALE